MQASSSSGCRRCADGVGAIQVNKSAGVGPNPPWDWADDAPAENEDPNQCQLYISCSNDQRVGQTNVSTGISYMLRINGETNWLVENIDFVSGGNTFEMRDGSGHVLRGVRVLGWAPPNMERNSALTDAFGNELDNAGSSTVERCHSMIEARNTTGIVVDRCEFWGGCAPWIGWDENKARHGAYSVPHKSNLWFFQSGDSVPGTSIRFVNTLCDGFPTVVRPSGKPIYAKFHQCSLRYWGMDGSLCCETPSETFEYIRSQMFEYTLTGMVNALAFDGSMYVGYNLMMNVRPFCHENGYWDSTTDIDNGFACAKMEITHEPDKKAVERQFYYNNTCIGSHNHMKADATKHTAGNPIAGMGNDGGCTIFPGYFNRFMKEWWSRNNINAVRPNGSRGSIPQLDYGGSGDSHAGVVMHVNVMGWQAAGGLDAYSTDYNIYHRGSGMPTLGSGHSDSVITMLNASGGEVGTNSITTVRSTTESGEQRRDRRSFVHRRVGCHQARHRAA